MNKSCRASFATAIAGRDDDCQEEAGRSRPTSHPGAGEFRARWNDELSEACRPIDPRSCPTSSGGKRDACRVEVYSYVPSGGKPVIFTGRQVEVQRLNAAGTVDPHTAREAAPAWGSNLYNRTYFANLHGRREA